MKRLICAVRGHRWGQCKVQDAKHRWVETRCTRCGASAGHAYDVVARMAREAMIADKEIESLTKANAELWLRLTHDAVGGDAVARPTSAEIEAIAERVVRLEGNRLCLAQPFGSSSFDPQCSKNSRKDVAQAIKWAIVSAFASARTSGSLPSSVVSVSSVVNSPPVPPVPPVETRLGEPGHPAGHPEGGA